MSKKVLLVLLLLLLLPVTSAGVVTLYREQSHTQGSWTFMLYKVMDNDSIQLKFGDGLYYTINNNGTIGGLWIKVIATIYDPTHQNDVAEINVLTLWENDCIVDADCNDGNSCTEDFCMGVEDTKCQYFTIDMCRDNDDCCPADCEYEFDNDCTDYDSYECLNNSMCNDSNSDTTDSCKKYECVYTPITSCRPFDDSCPVGCLLSHNEEDERADLDCHPYNECILNSDCNDGEYTTSDYCYAFPSTAIKKCIFVENETIEETQIITPSSTPGAVPPEFIEKCYLKSDRQLTNAVPYFCNGYVWVLQRAEGSVCTDRYECVSFNCINFRCQGEPETLREKIFSETGKYIFLGIVGVGIALYLIFYVFIAKKFKLFERKK